MNPNPAHLGCTYCGLKLPKEREEKAEADVQPGLR